MGRRIVEEFVESLSRPSVPLGLAPSAKRDYNSF